MREIEEILIFVVLGILLAVVIGVIGLASFSLGPVPPWGPNDEAGKVIKAYGLEIGVVRDSGIVTFTKNYPFLSGKTIANNSGTISKDQICLDVSPELREKFERSADGLLVEYKGDQSLSAKLLITCNTGNEMANSIITARKENYFQQCNNAEGSQPFCYVSIVPTNWYE